ncbi:hypothetical protein BKA80DRAFT_301301 [Phyllosticta citrichinensis]
MKRTMLLSYYFESPEYPWKTGRTALSQLLFQTGETHTVVDLSGGVARESTVNDPVARMHMRKGFRAPVSSFILFEVVLPTAPEVIAREVGSTGQALPALLSGAEHRAGAASCDAELGVDYNLVVTSLPPPLLTTSTPLPFCSINHSTSTSHPSAKFLEQKLCSSASSQASTRSNRQNEADIKLSKEDFNEISKMMNGDFSGEAIRQRVTKKIKKSFEGASPKKELQVEVSLDSSRPPYHLANLTGNQMVSPGKKSKGADLKKTKTVGAKKRGASALKNDTGDDEVDEKEADLPSKKVKAEPKIKEDIVDFNGFFDPYAN